MKFIGFPIEIDLKNLKKLKKLKKLIKLKKLKKLGPQNHPKPSKPPTIGYQHQTMPYGPRQRLTVANINDFLCSSYVYPMPAWPYIGKYQWNSLVFL